MLMRLPAFACRTMPVGYLADAGLLNATNTNSSIRNDAYQVGAFFSDVCAANNNTMGPIKLPGQNFTSKYPELCQACGACACCAALHASPVSLPACHPVVAMAMPFTACIFFRRELPLWRKGSMHGAANAVSPQGLSNSLQDPANCSNTDRYWSYEGE